jgi:hypothetical protein
MGKGEVRGIWLYPLQHMPLKSRHQATSKTYIEQLQDIEHGNSHRYGGKAATRWYCRYSSLLEIRLESDTGEQGSPG